MVQGFVIRLTRFRHDRPVGGIAFAIFRRYAANRLTRREYTGGSTMRIDQAYRADDQIEFVTRYSDLSGTTKVSYSTYTYDDAGRLTNLIHRKGSDNSVLANYTYTWDNHSRPTTEVTNGSTVTYAYDNADQVTADGSATFTYDATGNRNNGGYVVGPGNQMTNDGVYTYTYDNEGNLTKKSKGATQETWDYSYDQRNQLVMVEKRATDGGTLQLRATMSYDAIGNRIQKQVDTDGNGSVDTTQRYTYDGFKTGPQKTFVGQENWDVLADLDGSSSLTTRYVRSDAIDQLFARIGADNNAYWYLPDRLGSVRDITDNSGVLKDTIAYNAWGGIASESDANYRGRYTWTTREWDAESEFQYNRARYYDPKTARWMSRDPLGFGAGDSNLYRYVRNRPLMISDPSGLQGPTIGPDPSKVPNTRYVKALKDGSMSYYLNAGWVDWNHADPSFPNEVISRINENKERESELRQIAGGLGWTGYLRPQKHDGYFAIRVKHSGTSGLYGPIIYYQSSTKVSGPFFGRSIPMVSR